MTLRLTRLDASVPIVTSAGHPTHQFRQLYNNTLAAVETAFNGLEDAVTAIAAAQAAADAADAAAAAAQTAADNANAAAEEVTSGSNLANSYIANFTPPVVSADNTGLVTIANHDRVYGDGTTVAVTGDTLATGEAVGTIVYVFYPDPSRAGGAVVYDYSTVEADAAQIGDVHNVGAVEIPAAGTASGGYARPPGYGGVEP